MLQSLLFFFNYKETHAFFGDSLLYTHSEVLPCMCANQVGRSFFYHNVPVCQSTHVPMHKQATQLEDISATS